MRTRILTATATVLLLGSPLLVACSGDDTLVAGPSTTSAERPDEDDRPTAEATPAALATAAATPITSGHLQFSGSGIEVEASFDGDDVRISTTSPTPDGTIAGMPGAVSLLVDGQAYVGLGDRWISVPLDELPIDGAGQDELSASVASTVDALRSAAVTEPPTRATVDGVEVDRYRTTLTGTEADELLSGTGFGPYTAGDARSERIIAYVADHTTVDVVADVDGQDRLRRLEITSHVDVSEYPDCMFFEVTPPEVSMVLSEIGESQDIVAPPADQVVDMSELDPGDLLGEIVDGAGAATGGPELGLDEDDPIGGAIGMLEHMYEGCPE
jgi:hypothetical protein